MGNSNMINGGSQALVAISENAIEGVHLINRGAQALVAISENAIEGVHLINSTPIVEEIPLGPAQPEAHQYQGKWKGPINAKIIKEGPQTRAAVREEINTNSSPSFHSVSGVIHEEGTVRDVEERAKIRSTDGEDEMRKTEISSHDFLLTCNQTFDPPKLFFIGTNIELTGISLDGQVTVPQYIAYDCYDQNNTQVWNVNASITLYPWTVSNTANKLTIVGCDSYGDVNGLRLNERNYQTGCTATCDAIEDIETGSCTGLGCCQISIPKKVWDVEISLGSYNNYSEVSGFFNKCSYAFVAAEGAFNFSAESYARLYNMERLPMVVDWPIRNETCEKAKMKSTTYACKSANSACYIPDNAKGCSLSWEKRIRIATETAGVLSYLHSAASTPIIHRDIKSANILLDHAYTAKVSDFGTSRLVPLDQTEVTTLVQGTFGYLDPEYMQTNQLTEKSDVYSFGVVLVELLTGRKAVSKDRPEDERSLAHFFLIVMKRGVLFNVLDDNVATGRNTEVVSKVAVLAERCLNVRGDERPFMKEVAMELERLRDERMHTWIRADSTVSYYSASGFIEDEGSTSGAGFYSLGDHVIMPVGGGR
ncbi:hypothetical protein ACS0TY_036739 [Phlomoides rotata]